MNSKQGSVYVTNSSWIECLDSQQGVLVHFMLNCYC